MSYAKLHESILDSTIWQTALHVKVVWITMLAMKDIDGIVHASIPGLAKRAGVTVEQCEESLAMFLAPDKYSRTKDHEGRRIREVDGGWEVLNHDKYRDLLDADDQRAKAAERMRRYRERQRAGDVTVTPRDAGDVTVRHADTDADAGSEITPVSDLPLPELPDPGAVVGAERDPDPAPPPGSHAKFLRSTQVPHDGDFARRLSRLLTDSWQYGLATHNALRMTDGIDPHAQSWEACPGTQYPPWVAMREIATAELRTHGYDRARERIRHRIDVAAASARRDCTLRWFTPSVIWDPKQFARDGELSVQQALAPRAGPRLVPNQPRNEPERRPSKKLGS